MPQPALGAFPGPDDWSAHRAAADSDAGRPRESAPAAPFRRRKTAPPAPTPDRPASPIRRRRRAGAARGRGGVFARELLELMLRKVAQAKITRLGAHAAEHRQLAGEQLHERGLAGTIAP